MQKNWLPVFNVKVTVRAYIIKILLFLLCLLNCWSVCNQTLFDCTASYAGVSCGKKGLLCSRSRSNRRFKMSVHVCFDDIFSMCLIISAQYILNCSTIFFLPNLVWWCIIMRQCVLQKIGSLSSMSRLQ